MHRNAQQIALELLILRCQDGERSAWRLLIGQWHPRLLAHARRLINRPDAADDVVQDAWIAITRGLSRLDDPAAFRAWAYRIVSHKCADRIRQWKRDRKLEQSPNAVNPASPAHDPSMAEASDDDEAHLRHAIRALPPELHAVVAMHYREGMSLAEIAYALGIPTGTVKSRLFTARKRLAESLESYETKGHDQ